MTAVRTACKRAERGQEILLRFWIAQELTPCLRQPLCDAASRVGGAAVVPHAPSCAFVTGRHDREIMLLGSLASGIFWQCPLEALGSYQEYWRACNRICSIIRPSSPLEVGARASAARASVVVVLHDRSSRLTLSLSIAVDIHIIEGRAGILSSLRSFSQELWTRSRFCTQHNSRPSPQLL